MMQETKTPFDVWKILSVLSTIICLSVVAIMFSMAHRIAELEKVVSFREEADPLKPDECPMNGTVCTTTIDRVLAAPQKYHGRRLAVTGFYVSSFEGSALYSQELKGERSHSHAIWINGGLRKTDADHLVTIVGLFKRGPVGHMLNRMAEFGQKQTLPSMIWPCATQIRTK